VSLSLVFASELLLAVSFQFEQPARVHPTATLQLTGQNKVSSFVESDKSQNMKIRSKSSIKLLPEFR